MNLLDPANLWLLLRDREGRVRAANVYAISAPDVVDIQAPRADFRGALYQLLIGLLQTALPPADMDDWHELWMEPPDASALQNQFAALCPAFEITADGAAFMQDQDALSESNEKSTAELLIDLGADSNLFFNKVNMWRGLCETCFAQALFTLQINAPSGGVGHRTSLRGGGPLTTLVIPRDDSASLWHKLWLNILPLESLSEAMQAEAPLAAKLPWMGATRVSDKTGVETSPETVHPLQAYWSMPRRIRLDTTQTQAGQCEVCGQQHDALYTHYRTRNYGTNYTGNWNHPLTPYSHDPKHESLPLPTKGGRAASGYRQWLALTFGDHEQPMAADIVADFNKLSGKSGYLSRVRQEARLWCFGFEMDNMKAKAWHDSTLPLYTLVSQDPQSFVVAVRQLLEVAKWAAKLLGDQVKAARGMGQKDPVIEQSFWQHSETAFYAAVQPLAQLEQFSTEALVPIYEAWMRAVYSQMMCLFEVWVLCAPIEEMDMKNVVLARKGLESGWMKNKLIKELRKMIKTHNEDRHDPVS